MIIQDDPDRYRVEIRSHICGFHRQYPNKSHAGCTCSTSYGRVAIPNNEVEAIKRAKRLVREERILAEAASIRARRRATQAGETRSAETTGSARKGEHAVPNGDAPNV